jgi:hypothetical protein
MGFKKIIILFFPFILYSQNFEWVYTYNGQSDSVDQGFDMAVDSSGNIYIVGESDGNFTVISVSKLGIERWISKPAPGRAYSVVYGADGNIYVVGNIEGYLGVVSLTTSGNLRWIYTYQNAFFFGIGWENSIVFGADGNIYFTGTCMDNNIAFHLMIISLTTDGQERWVYDYYGGVGSPGSYSRAITYGNDNNIYVTGHYLTNLWIMSFTTSGNPRWMYMYNGPGNGFDMGKDIVYGNDNNIYVTGIVENENNNRDFAVISVDTSGAERWVYTRSGLGNNPDEGSSIIYGNDGNIYVSGYICTNNYNDFAILSLTNTGTERWVYEYDYSQDQDVGVSICFGADGYIYSAGWSINSNGNEDITIISLTPAGSQRWVYHYDGSSNDDLARSILYSSNIYAGGYTGTIRTNTDIIILNLNTTGIEEKSISENKGIFISPLFREGLLIDYRNPPFSVEIYDICARKIFSKNFYKHKVILNPFINEGIYFIRIKDSKGKIYTFKMIKE